MHNLLFGIAAIIVMAVLQAPGVALALFLLACIVGWIVWLIISGDDLPPDYHKNARRSRSNKPKASPVKKYSNSENVVPVVSGTAEFSSSGRNAGDSYYCYAIRTLKSGHSYAVIKWSDDDDLPPWRFKGGHMTRKPYWKARGFTYVVEFDDGKKYVGKKTFDRFDDWLDYVGSGVRVQKRIETRSKASQVVERVVVGIYDSLAELERAEKELQRALGVVKNPAYLNLRIGQE